MHHFRAISALFRGCLARDEHACTFFQLISWSTAAGLKNIECNHRRKCGAAQIPVCWKKVQSNALTGTSVAPRWRFHWSPSSQNICFHLMSSKSVNAPLWTWALNIQHVYNAHKFAFVKWSDKHKAVNLWSWKLCSLKNHITTAKFVLTLDAHIISLLQQMCERVSI